MEEEELALALDFYSHFPILCSQVIERAALSLSLCEQKFLRFYSKQLNSSSLIQNLKIKIHEEIGRQFWGFTKFTAGVKFSCYIQGKLTFTIFQPVQEHRETKHLQVFKTSTCDSVMVQRYIPVGCHE